GTDTPGAQITLSLNGQTSTAAPLTFFPGQSPTAVQVQQYLQGIPALTGNVAVVGPTGGPFTIAFGTARNKQVRWTLRVTANLPAIRNEVQQLNFTGTTITGGSFRLQFAGNQFPTGTQSIPYIDPNSNQFDPVTLAQRIQGAFDIQLGLGQVTVTPV